MLYKNGELKMYFSYFVNPKSQKTVLLPNYKKMCEDFSFKMLAYFESNDGIR